MAKRPDMAAIGDGMKFQWKAKLGYHLWLADFVFFHPGPKGTPLQTEDF